jgi:hypothetical protein
MRKNCVLKVNAGWMLLCAVAEMCPHDPAWQYIFELRDQKGQDDLPDSANEIAKGFARTEAFYIGNSALAAMQINEAEICVGRTTTCDPVCHRLTLDQLGEVFPCPLADQVFKTKSLKRTLALFTGQCIAEGASGQSACILKCERGNAEKCFNLGKYNGSPFIRAGMGSGVPECGVYQHYSSKQRNWHTWGYGISLSPWGEFAGKTKNYEFGGYEADAIVNLLQLRVTTKNPTPRPTSSPTSPPTMVPTLIRAGPGGYCPPGMFTQTRAEGVPCSACLTGMYQPSPNQTVCIGAPAGRFAAREGGSAVEATACPSGYYQRHMYQQACSTCSVGMYQAAPAQSSGCVGASAGHFVESLGSGNQTQCPSGKFQPHPYQRSCFLCAAGRYGPMQGSASVSSCAVASPGRFSLAASAAQVFKYPPAVAHTNLNTRRDKERARGGGGGQREKEGERKERGERESSE